VLVFGMEKPPGHPTHSEGFERPAAVHKHRFGVSSKGKFASSKSIKTGTFDALC
jgi:hypothetical protein